MPDYNPETILRLEFEYARETIEQNLEDRRKIVEFYVLVAGGLSSAGLALVQLEASRVPTLGQLDTIIGAGGRMPGAVYTLIFWAVGTAGVFTLLHLIRLRQAAHESMGAMNRIKEFYVARYPQVSEALVWRTHTQPPLNRIGSITFNLALLVVLLDSIAFAVGVVFFEIKSPIPLTAMAVGAGLLAFLWQALIYFAMLREK